MMRLLQSSDSLRAVPVLVAFAVMLALAGVADARERTAEETRSQLEGVNADIAAQEARLAEIKAELEALNIDRAEINARLIATGERIKRYETAVQQAEERLHDLGTRERMLREDLSGSREVLATLLAALQRMGRNQPPAVIVTPENALQSVRSALLLGAVVPSIRSDTETLAGKLNELVAVTKGIVSERERMASETDKLAEENLQLTALLETKTEATVETQGRISEESKRAKELAAKAADLEDLLAAIEKEAAKRPEPEPQRERSAREALADTGRLSPAIKFADAKGLLPHPAAGAVIRTYGSSDTYGGKSGGISIATRAKAQVTAPCDGWVAYSGPFRSYGQLLIIDAGDGYHVVMAGLETVSADVGQFVLTGEPIGQMGTLAMASAVSTDGGPIQPVLYVEFRKNGRAIDPSPWWVDDPDGAKS